MTSSYRASAEQWQQWLAEMQADLNYLALMGPELLKRAQRGTRDGYPSSSRMGEGSRPTGVPDPVLALVIERTDPARRFADPVRVAAVDITTLVVTSRAQVASAERIVSHWLAVEPEGLERKPVTLTCQACGRTVAGTSADRLRSGYCPEDYQAWRRAGRPDRAVWENQRREAS